MFLMRSGEAGRSGRPVKSFPGSAGGRHWLHYHWIDITDGEPEAVSSERVPLTEISKMVWRVWDTKQLFIRAATLASLRESWQCLIALHLSCFPFRGNNLTTVSARVELSLSVDTGKGWLQLFWKYGIYLYCPPPELFPLNTKGQYEYGK